MVVWLQVDVNTVVRQKRGCHLQHRRRMDQAPQFYPPLPILVVLFWESLMAEKWSSGSSSDMDVHTCRSRPGHDAQCAMSVPCPPWPSCKPIPTSTYHIYFLLLGVTRGASVYGFCPILCHHKKGGQGSLIARHRCRQGTSFVPHFPHTGEFRQNIFEA